MQITKLYYYSDTPVTSLAKDQKHKFSFFAVPVDKFRQDPTFDLPGWNSDATLYQYEVNLADLPYTFAYRFLGTVATHMLPLDSDALYAAQMRLGEAGVGINGLMNALDDVNLGQAIELFLIGAENGVGYDEFYGGQYLELVFPKSYLTLSSPKVYPALTNA